MTTPTPPAPDELAALIASRIGQDFDGECHLTEIEARLILSRLASQEETIRADGECLARIAGMTGTAGPTYETVFVNKIARARLSARQEGGAG